MKNVGGPLDSYAIMVGKRIGQFFLLSGILLGALFIFSDSAGTPQYELLPWVVGAFLLAYLLLRRGKGEQQPSGRFRTLNKLRGKGEQEEGE